MQVPKSLWTGYLALFLVLLAFLIVLSSRSTFSEEKTQKVLKSVDQAFRVPADQKKTATLQGDQGAALIPLDDRQRRLAGLFAAVLPEVRVSSPVPGDVLQVRFPKKLFFQNNAKNANTDHDVLLKNVADVLRENGNSSYISMNITLPVDDEVYQPGEMILPQPPLAAVQAASFAARMVEFGVDPAHVTISLDSSLAKEGAQIVIMFAIEGESTPSLTLAIAREVAEN